MSYQVELRHLYYFKTVAEELHFRRAAERLYIAQPGLSRQIKYLEEHFGTSLFLRNKRRVELTSAGRCLLQEVNLVFDQIHYLEKDGKNSKWKIDDFSGGSNGSAIQAVLPDLLLHLNQEQPEIDISLNELSTSLQLDLLEKFELDIGFVRMGDTPLGMESVPVLQETFSLVVPKRTGNDQRRLTDFSASPFILFSKEYSGAYYDLVMSIFTDHHFQPKVALKTVNALSIFTLVSRGLGVAIVPSSLRKGYHAAVDFIELSDIPQRTTLSVLWDPRNSNPAVPLFIDTLQKKLS